MKIEAQPPKCERQDELLDYLYDELSGTARASFAQHLPACARCGDDLRGLQRLRDDLRAWDVSTVPHIELVIPRSPWTVLQEMLSLFPVWARGVMALSAAATLLLMTLGAMSVLRAVTQPNAPTQSSARITTATPPAPAVQPAALTPELKTLVNAQITAELAKAIEQERQAIRHQMAAQLATQLATLSTRDTDQQARLQTLARQLRALQAQYDALLAEQQPSLRRLMSESFEPANER